MNPSAKQASSIYTRFASAVLFPLHERLKGHRSLALREELERSQWLGAAELRQLQIRRLKAFLSLAGQRVPYYRQMFKKVGFEPQELSGLADLQRLPLLTKVDIRAAVDLLKAEGHGLLKRYNTGGSSGEPLIFYMGRDRISHDVAAKWRATRWWGVDVGDSEAVIWGSPIEHGAQDRIKVARDRLFRSTLLPAFEMSPAKLDAFVEWILRNRPRMLFGYPSALTLIARHAAERGVRLDCLGIRVAFVTSERLYGEQRQAIQSAFGCPVANGYGGRDSGFIAHECPSGGMHLSAEDIVVETIGADGQCTAPGIAGEIVVTHMATADFPFIRYRTGDVGVLDDAPCPCGRGLPLLKELQGRTTDFVVAADGTVMHGLALIYVLRGLPGIQAFKVIQHSLQRTQVQIVTDQRFEPRAEESIRAAFRERLGPEVQIDLDFVVTIPPEPSGKYRYVVSRVTATH